MMAISGRPGSLHRATRARQGARDPVNRPGYRSGSYPARTKARRRTATNGRERASGSGRSPQGPARLGTHPDQPALVVIVDEYAEMPEEAHDCADSIARRGGAVAVNLIAATQRPSQQAMGKGAVRSQMDVRICLRVRERRATDLILGQRSFNAGWHAHALTRPGEFLLPDPEHAKPERGRAYLIDDHAVAAHAREHGIGQLATGTDPQQSASVPPQWAADTRTPAPPCRRPRQSRSGAAVRPGHGWAAWRVHRGPDASHRQRRHLGLRTTAAPRRRRAGDPDHTRLLGAAAPPPVTTHSHGRPSSARARLRA